MGIIINTGKRILKYNIPDEDGKDTGAILLYSVPLFSAFSEVYYKYEENGKVKEDDQSKNDINYETAALFINGWENVLDEAEEEAAFDESLVFRMDIKIIATFNSHVLVKHGFAPRKEDEEEIKN